MGTNQAGLDWCVLTIKAVPIVWLLPRRSLGPKPGHLVSGQFDTALCSGAHRYRCSTEALGITQGCNSRQATKAPHSPMSAPPPVTPAAGPPPPEFRVPKEGTSRRKRKKPPPLGIASLLRSVVGGWVGWVGGCPLPSVYVGCVCVTGGAVAVAVEECNGARVGDPTGWLSCSHAARIMRCYERGG